ncbi:hypothetical protein [Leisingera methylohalidivorans]|uniref:hypothetical protein n=1 Tax=Leisingera methylohalidivorans TaxID=133924 RepID=UPI0012EBF831|nr:hypothetical protein [Leisingera methylohalidivorans]
MSGEEDETPIDERGHDHCHSRNSIRRNLGLIFSINLDDRLGERFPDAGYCCRSGLFRFEPAKALDGHIGHPTCV